MSPSRKYKRGRDGALEVDLTGFGGSCNALPLFTDDYVCVHNEKRGTICGACRAKLRAQGYQDGYAAGYRDGQGERP